MHSHLNRMRKIADVKQFNLAHFHKTIAGRKEKGAERGRDREFCASADCGRGGGCISRGGPR